MEKRETIKDATFAELDKKKIGDVIKAFDFVKTIRHITHTHVSDDTVKRYLRKYRTKRPIENISKAKSIYRMAG